MDWTGGSRRRYAAPKANEVLQKQKNHFARARAKSQHTPASWHALLPDHQEDYHYRAVSGYHQSNTLHGQRDHGPRRHSRHSMMPHSSYSREMEAQSARNSIDDAPIQDAKGMKGHGRPPRAAIGANAEELQLLANRRKLLARDDWLRLAPTRPLQMRFPSAGDQDQVGRRRKIRKLSAQMANPAHPRLLTPIFGARLEPTDHLQRAGPFASAVGDQLRIKIGTDAFASQSGVSRLPNTPTNRSIRYPSSNFGSLSEESMLLGEDGDTFDANQVKIPSAPFQPNDRTGVDSMDAYAGSQLPPVTADSGGETGSSGESNDNDCSPLRRVTDKDNRGSGVSIAAPMQEIAGYIASHSQELDQDYPAPAKERQKLQLQQSSSPAMDCQSDVRGQADDVSTPSFESRSSRPGSPDSFGTAEKKADESWKRMLGLRPDRINTASQLAVVSSSDHNTTSDSSHHLPDRAYTNQPYSNAKPEATVQKVVSRPQDSVARYQEPISREENVTRTEANSPLVFPSEAQDPLQQPDLKRVPNINDEDDGDANWRQFFTRSQSSESDDYPHRFLYDKDIPSELSAMHPSPEVSGLDTSDHATPGVSLFVTDDSRTFSEAIHGDQSAALPTDLAADGSTTGTKGFDSLEVEDETIEDSPVTQANPCTNIHASSMEPLNPRRFKKPTRTAAVVASKPSTRSSARSQYEKGQVSRRRSVYDLVDSDGVSLSG